MNVLIGTLLKLTTSVQKRLCWRQVVLELVSFVGGMPTINLRMPTINLRAKNEVALQKKNDIFSKRRCISYQS